MFQPPFQQKNQMRKHKEALLILKNSDGIGIIQLDDKDVIRHSLVKKIIEAYKTIEHNN